jgi:hypothetical protein
MTFSRNEMEGSERDWGIGVGSVPRTIVFTFCSCAGSTDDGTMMKKCLVVMSMHLIIPKIAIMSVCIEI